MNPKEIAIGALEKGKDLLVAGFGLLKKHAPFVRKGAPKGSEDFEAGLKAPGLEELEAPGLEAPWREEPGLDLEEPKLDALGLEEPTFEAPAQRRAAASGFEPEMDVGRALPHEAFGPAKASAPEPAYGSAQLESLKLEMKNIEEMIENLNRRFDTLGSSIDLLASQGEYDKSLLQRHDHVLRELSEKSDLLQKQHQAIWDKLAAKG